VALPQSTPPATKPAPPATSTPTITFHSDVLHLDYTYSSSLTARPDVADQAIQAEKDKSTGATKVAMSCITLPLVTTDASNGLRMVLIMRMDGACLGHASSASELGTVATSALTQSLLRFGNPQVGSSTSYQVAGHPASVISGSVKSEKYGTTFYGMASCLIQGGDSVCWEILASDCSKLPELMANPVKFDGQPAEALIPEKFAQSCKP
jgi:hypothetical protein